SLGLPILALLITAILSALATTERFVAVTELLFDLELCFMYWLALNMVQSEAEFERVVKLLFVTLVMQSIIYFLQAQLGFQFNLEGDGRTLRLDVPRPGGTVSTTPAGFASFVIPILMIAIVRSLSRRRPRASLSLWVLVGLGTMAVGLTVTRAAWVGLAIALAWVLAVGVARRALHPRKGGLAAVGVAARGVSRLPRMNG